MLKININDLNDNKDFIVPINITNEFSNFGSEMVIENEFIPNAINSSINEINDFDRVKYKPFFNGKKLNTISYSINSDNQIINLGNLNFDEDDLFFKKNGFIKSYLSLLFYDSPIITKQNLIYRIDLYPYLRSSDFIFKDGIKSNYPKPIDEIFVRFYRSDVDFNSESYSDGYSIFYGKEKSILKLNTELYMRGVFNNAKTGKQLTLANSNVSFGINEVQDFLFTKYVLSKDQNGFIYTVEQQNNVFYNSVVNDLEVKLYVANFK